MKVDQNESVTDPKETSQNQNEKMNHSLQIVIHKESSPENKDAEVKSQSDKPSHVAQESSNASEPKDELQEPKSDKIAVEVDLEAPISKNDKNS